MCSYLQFTVKKIVKKKYKFFQHLVLQLDTRIQQIRKFNQKDVKIYCIL